MGVTVRGKKRRRKNWNLVESIFFIFLVLITGFVLLNSPVFEVRTIQVRGNQFLDEERIRAVAGIGTGVNIFKADLKAASAGLRLVPMVKDVRITRSLPSTVVIKIQERKPLALLPVKEGFIEVDSEGVYLRQSGAGTPGLPVITGVRGEMPEPGQPVRDEKLKHALSVVEGLPAEAVGNLSEVHVDEAGLIRIYTIDGVQCRFGPATEISEKGAVFLQVLKEVRSQGKKIHYIDLSCAGSPVVYYKQH
ncbi:MAG: FtsQ-type POTRA domain-containing protein [Firmicutes bacterium]|nr:FtsQ-type POTRA domain-containing protein [Bacillota bacterium]